MKRQLGTGLFALFALVAASACSVDDFIEFGGVIGVDDGASKGAFKSQLVDGSKDVRIELKTGAAVTLPEDAVESEVEIGLRRPDDEKAISLVKSLKDYQAIVSAPYVLTPHGTKFREPVSIELPITKQTDKKLVVGWLENEGDTKWKMLGVPVVKDGIAKLDIDHFSVVILLEEDRANLADGDAGDSASDASAVNDKNDSGARLDDGQGPTATADAGRAGSAFDAGGPISIPVMTFDAGFPVFDKDAGAAPFPFGDAAVMVGADAGSTSPGPEAGASDASADGAVDAAANDGGKAPTEAGADAAINDAG